MRKWIGKVSQWMAGLLLDFSDWVDPIHPGSPEMAAFHDELQDIIYDISPLDTPLIKGRKD